MNIYNTWRRSSFSEPENNCIELTPTAAEVLIRDSKNTSGPTIRVGDVLEFLDAVKGERFDR